MVYETLYNLLHKSTKKQTKIINKFYQNTPSLLPPSLTASSTAHFLFSVLTGPLPIIRMEILDYDLFMNFILIWSVFWGDIPVILHGQLPPSLCSCFR